MSLKPDRGLTIKPRPYYTAKHWWQWLRIARNRRRIPAYGWTGVRLLGITASRTITTSWQSAGTVQRADGGAGRCGRDPGRAGASGRTAQRRNPRPLRVCDVRRPLPGQPRASSADSGAPPNAGEYLPRDRGDRRRRAVRLVPRAAAAADLGRNSGSGPHPSFFSFGAQSRTHPILTHLSDDEAWEEIFGAKRDLEEQLKERVTTFCYPGGLFTDREQDYVRRAGFTAGITCEPGVNSRTSPESTPTDDDRSPRHRRRLPRQARRAPPPALGSQKLVRGLGDPRLTRPTPG